MNDQQLRSLLDFALDAAYQAGRLTTRYFQTGIDFERKKDNSPVTVADKEAEKLIRGLLERYYPDYGIIGEEFGRVESKNGLNWTVDPIDGTKSFICGVPFYGNLLALLDENERSIVGVINLPALNEVVYAARGAGAYWNGRRVQTSKVASLSDAVMLASDMIGYGARESKYQTLLNSTFIQRTWGDSYGYTLVATGRADFIVDPVMNVWDSGPLQVIVEEAGGTFTDWNGRSNVYARDIIATNGALFDPIMAITRD